MARLREPVLESRSTYSAYNGAQPLGHDYGLPRGPRYTYDAVPMAQKRCTRVLLDARLRAWLSMSGAGPNSSIFFIAMQFREAARVQRRMEKCEGTGEGIGPSIPCCLVLHGSNVSLTVIQASPHGGKVWGWPQGLGAARIGRMAGSFS